MMATNHRKEPEPMPRPPPRFMRAAFLVSAAITALALPGLLSAGGGATEKDWVHRIQATYAQVADFSADFVQTYKHPLKDTLKRSYGKVYFRKGGLMRWEYEKPEPKLFVFDGASLWMFEPQVPQIVVTQGQNDRFRRSLAFLIGESNLDEEYHVSLLDGPGLGYTAGPVLGLKPKDPSSFFEQVELYLDPNTALVVRSVLVDRDGGRNRVDFVSPKLNTNPSPTLFRFTPPAGVPVVKAEDAARP